MQEEQMIHSIIRLDNKNDLFLRKNKDWFI